MAINQKVWISQAALSMYSRNQGTCGSRDKYWISPNKNSLLDHRPQAYRRLFDSASSVYRIPIRGLPEAHILFSLESVVGHTRVNGLINVLAVLKFPCKRKVIYVVILVNQNRLIPTPNGTSLRGTWARYYAQKNIVLLGFPWWMLLIPLTNSEIKYVTLRWPHWLGNENLVSSYPVFHYYCSTY